MDPDTRRLVMFAGGLGVVLVVLIGASFLIGHRGTEVPVVAADTRPIRIKPENPGGMKINGTENDVFSGGTDTANSKLSALPENPDTRVLRTTEAPAPSTAETSAPVALAPPIAKPAPGSGTSGSGTPGSSTTGSSTTGSSTTGSSMGASGTGASGTGRSAGGSGTARPSGAKSTVVATEAHPAASAHKAIVQLAALSSEEAARNEWQTLSKRMPDLLNGRQPAYSRIQRDGHTFWRVRTAGFADVAQARAFCERIRTKGGGCSIVDF
jgi:hypothetical protein